MVIGTTTAGKVVRFLAGGINKSNIVLTLTSTGPSINSGAQLTFGDGSSQSVAAAPANYTQSAFTAANTNATNIAIIQGVNVTQNNNTTAVNNYAAGAYGLANTNASNITLVNQYASGAYAKANAALANTTGTFDGNLNINGYISLNTAGGIYQETASPSVMVANTTGSFSIVTRRGNNPNVWNFGENGTLTAPSDVNVTGNLTSATLTTGNTVTAGTSRIRNTSINDNTPVLQVIATGNNFSYLQPTNPNYMIHVVGKDGITSRVVNDAVGNGVLSSYVMRTARGAANAPTAIQAGDVFGRISTVGYATTGFSTASDARIDFSALENFSDTNKGSAISLWATQNTTNTLTRTASFSSGNTTLSSANTYVAGALSTGTANATFNSAYVEFSGIVNPTKGFVYNSTIYPGAQTAISIDFSDGPIIRAQTSSALVATITNPVQGKVVDVWITNISGAGQTFTHGCSAINSTVNATTYNIPGTSSIFAKYFCMDGTLANTFVAIIHS